ncbi:MAG: hypothetical protein ABII12_13535 [Planctomycetota bacterium]
MAAKLGWNDRIRRAVRDSGLSLYRVAADSGLSVGPVQRFMQGAHGLTVDSAERIARVVGLELRAVNEKRGKAGTRRRRTAKGR